MERSRALTVYWCPRCEVQSERPWHLCKASAPLFPQTAEGTQCERIEVVRTTDHQGAVEALRDAEQWALLTPDDSSGPDYEALLRAVRAGLDASRGAVGRD